MASRTRTRSRVSSGVYKFEVNNGFISQANDTATIELHQCTDVTGSPDVDHALTIKHLDCSNWSPFRGIQSSGTFAGSGYYSDYYAGVPLYCQGHLPLDFSSTAADLTKAIARTNPSRPGVTPLTLIQDLVEIPRQLKDVGKLLRNPRSLLSAREIANQNLAIRFGWLPLVQDVKDLFNLQSAIHNRVGELDRLYSHTGLHRRIKLGTASAEKTSSQVTSSFTGVGGTSLFKQYSYGQRWATVRWKPTAVPKYNPSDADRIRQARQLVSGMTLEGLMNGLWEVIPWTWVIDWFTDVHSYAMTWSNTVPAIPYSACVMQDVVTISNITTTPSTGSALTGGNGTIIYETKERFVGGASVNAFLPFIGQDRLSILGSLFIQRFKR